MTDLKLVVPLLLAACAEAPGELAPPTTAPIEFTRLGVVTTVATGGYETIAIADDAAVGLSATATEGYVVEPVGGAWPNMIEPEYHVRALVAGTGSFAIQTSHGVAAGDVASADVVRVALAPVNYALDGHSRFIVDPALPELEVDLFDNRGYLLVDGSLRIAGAPQLGWDRMMVTSAAQLTIEADSIAAMTFSVDMADRVDRIVQVAELGRTCLHAYRDLTDLDVVEVVSPLTLVHAPIPGAANCW